jgi:hypothetical protein
MRLSEITAGITLNKGPQMLIAEQKEAVRKLQERARDQANEQVSEGSEREVGGDRDENSPN